MDFIPEGIFANVWRLVWLSQLEKGLLLASILSTRGEAATGQRQGHAVRPAELLALGLLPLAVIPTGSYILPPQRQTGASGLASALAHHWRGSWYLLPLWLTLAPPPALSLFHLPGTSALPSAHSRPIPLLP